MGNSMADAMRDDGDGGSIDLHGIGQALHRHKIWIGGVTLAALLASAAYVTIVKPRYTAEARVLIERWRVFYNTRRPHGSLGYRPPAPETRRLTPLQKGGIEELPKAA